MVEMGIYESIKISRWDEIQDIGIFNKAKLAKKWWKLIQDLKECMVNVFKKCHFLEAQLGHSPSCIWRVCGQCKACLRRVVFGELEMGATFLYGELIDP